MIVRVRVFDCTGILSGPVDSPRVVKTDEEWKKILTPAQYEIARAKGTEPAFCGTLLDNHTEGVYACVCCGLPLFSSDSKFNSGTGWPSFFQPIAPENVIEKRDSSLGMVRSEILCARCDGHLGHVFDDGPRPTGLRFCLNSESLTFTPTAELAKLADPAAEKVAAAGASAPDGLSSAVLAGGCFWCTEAVFEQLEGVTEVISGYAGDSAATADYKTVCTGKTNHAEAIQIKYDPAKISYEKLLEVFFTVAHDPTQLNQQGNDMGRQYRSAVFYADETQKKAAEAYIRTLTKSHVYDKPIVTTLEPLVAFHRAEAYHQDYAKNNPNEPYVAATALPKIEKVRKKFAGEVKPGDGH